MDEMIEKQAYAAATNGPTSAWHVCECHKCPYAFADCNCGETSVDWKLLRAARSAFAPHTITGEEIARRKQASRDEDERALASGEKTRDDLRRENGLFAPFGDVHVRYDGAKPLR